MSGVFQSLRCLSFSLGGGWALCFFHEEQDPFAKHVTDAIRECLCDIAYSNVAPVVLAPFSTETSTKDGVPAQVGCPRWSTVVWEGWEVLHHFSGRIEDL